jgi:hypothetical protein
LSHSQPETGEMLNAPAVLEAIVNDFGPSGGLPIVWLKVRLFGVKWIDVGAVTVKFTKTFCGEATFGPLKTT